MKSIRLLRALSSSTQIKDERKHTSLQIFSRSESRQSENERLRQELDEAHRIIERLKSSTPSRSQSHGVSCTDESTVVSNASTVKAGSSPSRDKTSKHTPLQRGLYGHQSAPNVRSPTLPTVFSEEPMKPKPKLFFLKKRNETVLSGAAMKLAQQEYAIATQKASRPKKPQLSLTMKRYLCTMDSPGSERTSESLAEF